MPKIRMERTHHALITEGVQGREQTLTHGKPFWTMMVANLGVGVWLMGVLLSVLNLPFADAMFVLVIGCVLGSALPAATAMLGPKTRLSQMEAGRFSMGRTGKKLPAFLNWAGAIGWDVIVNTFSASALVAVSTQCGFAMPFGLALGLLVVAQMFIGIYGHHLIQDTSKYLGALLGLLFAVIGLIAMHRAGTPTGGDQSSLKNIFSGLVLLIAFNATGWATYTADYTRYLPPKTPGRTVFLAVFGGLFISFFVQVFFGYMCASAVTEQTPEGIVKALQALAGHFSPLVLLVIAVSAIPVNAVNDNSAAYSLMSAGFRFPRPVSAALGAVLGYFICLLASDSFMQFFENFLYLFAHWIAPWAAIILVHWYMVGRKEQITPSGITRGCVIFVAVSALSIFLFSANSLYMGVLSGLFDGVDIGPYIGFVTASLIYYLSLRFWPVRYKT